MEISEVVFVGYSGVGVDLHAHLIDCRVEEQPAVGVEQLLADARVELPGHSCMYVFMYVCKYVCIVS